jgi:hypothetical protein
MRRPLRFPPRLLIEVELEQPARFVLDCDTDEDERRLRCWLHRTRALEVVGEIVPLLIEQLDELDDDEAA